VRRRALLAAALAFLAGAAGCTFPKREVILQQPDGTTVWRVSGLAPRPAAPPLAALSSAELEGSLRRITVRYHRVVSFVKTDPMPLLTVEQAREFAPLLAKELPRLAPRERMRVQFRDARTGNQNVMEVYPQPPFLVYEFEWLVVNPEGVIGPGGDRQPGADIEVLPGQMTSLRFSVVTLKDPVSGAALDAAQAAKAKTDLILAARSEQIMDDSEGERLVKLAETQPRVSLEAWRLYLDKRRTLSKARAQGLMDEAAYSAQLTRLERELAP
jgi:hypothetical protein